MIPAALFAMLAIARLGAIRAVVFGGFSPPSLAQRMEASRPKAIMTASCGIEGNKGSMATSISLRMPLRRVNSSHKRLLSGNAKSCDKIRLLRRPVSGIGRLVKSAKNRCLKAAPVAVKSSDGLYIIYTSGRLHGNSISKVKHY